MQNQKKTWKIIAESNDCSILDGFIGTLLKRAMGAGLKKSQVHLPIKKTRFNILSSSFIYNKHRDPLEHITHRRAIYIYLGNRPVTTISTEFGGLTIPPGVKISIKPESTERREKRKKQRDQRIDAIKILKKEKHTEHG